MRKCGIEYANFRFYMHIIVMLVALILLNIAIGGVFVVET